jgi:hypothetical protein
MLVAWLHSVTMLNVSSIQWQEEHGAVSILNSTEIVVSTSAATYRYALSVYSRPYIAKGLLATAACVQLITKAACSVPSTMLCNLCGSYISLAHEMK